MTARLLLIGAGDLAQKLSLRFAAEPEIRELIIASRDCAAADALAALADVSGMVRVHAVALDAGRVLAVERLLRRERVDLIVHAATRMSPWHVVQRPDHLGDALRRAGFAIQLPAQLPLIRAVMSAAREVGFAGPVVNCSYPDVINTALHQVGLAPTVGIGNVAMIAARVRAALRHCDEQTSYDNTTAVRVIAHHAHVREAMNACPPPALESSLEYRQPRVYIGLDGERADELAYAGKALPATRELNSLTAATGVEAIRALISQDGVARLSLPGPWGLPGGYPVEIEHGRLTPDLPMGAKMDDAISFNTAAAALDGVDHIDGDGTIHFTAAARQAVRDISPSLAEPLRPADEAARCAELLSLLGHS